MESMKLKNRFSMIARPSVIEKQLDDGFRNLLACLKFAVYLIFWSIPGFIAAVLWTLPTRFNKINHGRMIVDLSKNETATVVYEYCLKISEQPFIRFWCAEIQAGLFMQKMPVIFFVPLVLTMLCLKMKPCIRISLFILQWAVCILQVVFFLYGPYGGDFFVTTTPLNVLIPAIAVFVFVGRPQALLLLRLIILSGISYFVIFGHELFGGYGDLLFLCVIWPFFREITSFCGRYISMTIIRSKHVSEEQFGYFFILLNQVFLAVWFRIAVTNIQSSDTFFLLVLVSSIIEILMRTTTIHRDRFSFRLAKRGMSLFSGLNCKKSATIIPQSLEQTLDKSETVEAKHGKLYAMVIIGDMISEYVAILHVMALFFLFNDAKLAYPIPAFSEMSEPFNSKLDIKGNLVRGFGQLFSELIVDMISLYVESNLYKLPILEAWSIPSIKMRVFIISSASICGTSAAFSMFISGQGKLRTQPCDFESLDMCSCGPPPDSIFAKYCLRLYPSTNGVPPLR